MEYYLLQQQGSDGEVSFLARHIMDFSGQGRKEYASTFEKSRCHFWAFSLSRIRYGALRRENKSNWGSHFLENKHHLSLCSQAPFVLDQSPKMHIIRRLALPMQTRREERGGGETKTEDLKKLCRRNVAHHLFFRGSCKK
jgi:hypothetical protein